jgi:hypothetical protein
MPNDASEGTIVLAMTSGDLSFGRVDRQCLLPPGAPCPECGTSPAAPA